MRLWDFRQVVKVLFDVALGVRNRDHRGVVGFDFVVPDCLADVLVAT